MKVFIYLARVIKWSLENEAKKDNSRLENHNAFKTVV